MKCGLCQGLRPGCSRYNLQYGDAAVVNRGKHWAMAKAAYRCSYGVTASGFLSHVLQAQGHHDAAAELLSGRAGDAFAMPAERRLTTAAVLVCTYCLMRCQC